MLYDKAKTHTESYGAGHRDASGFTLHVEHVRFSRSTRGGVRAPASNCQLNYGSGHKERGKQHNEERESAPISTSLRRAAQRLPPPPAVLLLVSAVGAAL